MLQKKIALFDHSKDADPHILAIYSGPSRLVDKPYLLYSDKEASANSVDPDQTLKNATSDQGLHCLPLIQQRLDTANR